MARKAQPIKLSTDELRSLTTILRRGATPARVQTRARVLDLLHRGRQPESIAATLNLSVPTVFNLKRRYLSEGLDAALIDRPRSGQPCRISGVLDMPVSKANSPTPHNVRLAKSAFVQGARRRWHDRLGRWLRCAYGGCTTAAVACALSGPGWLGCFGAWCAGAEAGCVIYSW